jgi:hypothetical protein
MNSFELRYRIAKRAKALTLDFTPSDGEVDDNIRLRDFPAVSISGNCAPFLFTVETADDQFELTPFDTAAEFMLLMSALYPEWHDLCEAYVLAREVDQTPEQWFAHPDTAADEHWQKVARLHHQLRH